MPTMKNRHKGQAKKPPGQPHDRGAQGKYAPSPKPLPKHPVVGEGAKHAAARTAGYKM